MRSGSRIRRLMRDVSRIASWAPSAFPQTQPGTTMLHEQERPKEAPTTPSPNHAESAGDTPGAASHRAARAPEAGTRDAIAVLAGGIGELESTAPLEEMQRSRLMASLLDPGGEGRPSSLTLAFASRARLDACLASLQRAIDGNTALRSGVAWALPSRPMRFTLREATLRVHTARLAAGIDGEAQLTALAALPGMQIDPQRPPLLHAVIARLPGARPWRLQLLASPLAIGLDALATFLREAVADDPGAGLAVFQRIEPLPAALRPAPWHEIEACAPASTEADDADVDTDTALRAQLAALAAEATGLASNGLHADLLGSEAPEQRALQALRIAMQVRDRLDVSIPLGALLAAPTPAGMATYLCGVVRARARVTGQDEPAPIPIQAGRHAQPPVFCLPGAGASAASFVALATALGPGVPIHGLQVRGLDPRQAPETSVEDAARRHLQSILALCPQGPMRIVAHSFGGWIALETARQLERLGRRCAPLVLLDSPPPPILPLAPEPSPADILRTLVRLLEQSSGLSFQLDDATIEAAAASDFEARLAFVGSLMRDAALLPPAAGAHRDAAIAPMLRTFEAQLRSCHVARGRLDGEAIVIVAHDGGEGGPMPGAFGWSALVEHVEFAVMRGNHMSLLQEPAVREIALTMRERWRIV
ncbi:alpha/beta fold hydrolase [Burkholderia gladioli]|uniref:thioesterase domain-containing protein n=2 Tax=Burkholderia gladioli TaxID=28095 RepID=UPI0011B27AF5|nr:alpha/beta fold hydrolase [Burkholderia gladioli]